MGVWLTYVSVTALLTQLSCPLEHHLLLIEHISGSLENFILGVFLKHSLLFHEEFFQT